MKVATLSLIVFQLITVPAVAQHQSHAVDSIVKNAADAFLKDPHRMALSIAVYEKGQSSIYYFGKQGPNEHTPVASSTYEIGSITKTMTGLLLARAVTDGKAALNDDVRKYLEQPYPNLEFAGQPIRLAQLLNHSSGLPFFLAADSNGGRVESKREFLTALHQVKLDAIPGINLKYSNSAAYLLSIVLENIYRKSYAKLLNEFIFSPLHMSGTTLSINRDVLKGYNDKAIAMQPTQTGPAGGIRSTIGDMLIYSVYQLNENIPVVKISHQPTWGQINPYAVGLNWQMTHRPGRKKTIFQTGGTAGFTSYQILYPDQNIAVVLLTNEADPSAPDRLSDAGFQIADFLNGL